MTQFCQVLLVLALILKHSESQRDILSTLRGPQSLSSLRNISPEAASMLGIAPATLRHIIKQVYPQLLAGSVTRSSNYTKLRKFNLEPNMTVSGISGGGSFSMMLAFIHSSFIKGAGIFAGAPFGAGLIGFSEGWNIFNPRTHFRFIDNYSRKGFIDNSSNIASNSGVFIYRGIFDFTPLPYALLNIQEFLHYGMPRSKIRHVNYVPSGHCIPIKHGHVAQKICPIGGDFAAICDCNYEGIFEMFSHIYPKTFIRPDSTFVPVTGTLYKFSQSEFLPNKNAFAVGWWDFGYMYVPKDCEHGETQCKLHMAFPGCGQTEIAMYLGHIPEFIKDTGYLQAADANNMIILFPMPRITLITGSIGCFDIYGFTSILTNNWSTRDGVQPAAIKKMYERLVYGI